MRNSRLFAVLVALLWVVYASAPAGAAETPPSRVINSNNPRIMCLDLPGTGPGTVGGGVYIYPCVSRQQEDNQLWKLVYSGQANIHGEPLFTIQNLKDNLCLDVPGYNAVPAATPVSEYWCNNSWNDNQQFFFTARSKGWWLVNYISGLCLDVDGLGTPDNARITLWWCSDNDDHFWSYDPWTPR